MRGQIPTQSSSNKGEYKSSRTLTIGLFLANTATPPTKLTLKAG